MKVGAIVNYHLDPNDKPINGSHVHPAMVVSVHSKECVNLRVFLDSHEILWETSVGPAQINEGVIERGFSCK